MSNQPMSHDQHSESAARIVARCAIITLSDTRGESTDTSGSAIRQLLLDEGHQVNFYRIIPDEPLQLRALIEELLARADIDVIVTTGGTGVSGRDQTVEVIENVLEMRLPGFGELFRMLSFEQIGSAAMLSRAVAGISRRKPIFALPGSTRAVELAMTRLILPEMRHLLGQLDQSRQG